MEIQANLAKSQGINLKNRRKLIHLQRMNDKDICIIN